MLLITSFIALLVADLAAGKSILINRSPVNLPISRRANFTSVHNLLKHDQARAKYLKAKGAVKASGDSFHEYSVINQVIENQAVGYIAAVGVGIPPTTCKLWFDDNRRQSDPASNRLTFHRHWEVRRRHSFLPTVLHKYLGFLPKAQTHGLDLVRLTRKPAPAPRLQTMW